jgi:hypothetical protein
VERWEWDDNAADIINIPAISNQTVTLANGPCVLLGHFLWNQGAVAVGVNIFDGTAKTIWGISLGINARSTFTYPDKGLYIETDLEIQVQAAQPVNGSIWVRFPPRWRKEAP